MIVSLVAAAIFGTTLYKKKNMRRLSRTYELAKKPSVRDLFICEPLYISFDRQF